MFAMNGHCMRGILQIVLFHGGNGCARSVPDRVGVSDIGSQCQVRFLQSMFCFRIDLSLITLNNDGVCLSLAASRARLGRTALQRVSMPPHPARLGTQTFPSLFVVVAVASTRVLFHALKFSKTIAWLSTMFRAGTFDLCIFRLAVRFVPWWE
jgi:hypothetical protein